jgi:hypothetical protein
MNIVKVTLLFLIVFGLSVFGIFNPNDYTSFQSIQYLITYNSVLISLYLLFTSDKFEKHLMDQDLFEIIGGFKWISIYHMFSLLFIPLIISIPFLLAYKLKLFIVIFSTCYLQALIIITLFRLFYNQKIKKLWLSITMIFVLSVVLSSKFEDAHFLIMNPFLSVSYIPYFIDQEFTSLNLISSFIITFSLISGIQFLNKNMRKIYS